MTIALIAGTSGIEPSFAAAKVSMIGVVDNADAIASCSLSIDTAAKTATPLVTMQPPARTTPVDIRFTLFDAVGTLVETHDVSVPPPSFGPALAPFSYTANFARAHCDLKPAAASSADATASPAAAGGGGGGSGALIVIGALAAVGIVAVAAGSGHGGGGSNSSSPTTPPNVTPTPGPASPTPIPARTATPKATTVPTATPTGKATVSPTAKATATPTPGPTATPTAGPLTLTPPSLAFTSTGSSQSKTSTASESNYGGTFSASSSTCGSIATIAGPSGGTFTVTPTGAGNCSFAIADTHGMSAQLAVTVTITNGTIETRRRTPTPRNRN